MFNVILSILLVIIIWIETFPYPIYLFSIYSCPYFRNEVGGEGERSVVLSRSKVSNNTSKNKNNTAVPNSSQPFCKPNNNQSDCQLSPNSTLLHIPSAARGFSLLDTAETRWKNGYCPYQNHGVVGQGTKNQLDIGIKYIIERVDEGALFYKNFFYGQGKKNKHLSTL